MPIEKVSLLPGRMPTNRSRLFRLVLPCCGVLLSIGGAAVCLVAERRALRLQYETACESRTLAMRRHVDSNLAMLRVLQGFASSDGPKGWSAMHGFVTSITSPGKDIARYYWWNPRVSPGAVQPLDAYPADSFRVVFHPDIVKELVALSASHNAPAAAVLTDGRPIGLVAVDVQHTGSEPGEGLVLAFDVEDLTDDAVGVLQPLGIHFSIYDAAGRLIRRPKKKLARGHPLFQLLQPDPQEWMRNSPLRLADTTWTLNYRPREGYIPNSAATAAGNALLAGLLLTVLLDVLFEQRKRQSAAAGDLAALREKQLAETEVRLEDESIGKQSAEASLKRSEDRFRQVYRDAHVGMILVASNGTVLEVNQTVCRMTGYAEYDILGKSILSMMAEEDREPASRQMADLFAKIVPTYVSHRRYRRKDGNMVWVRTSVCLFEEEIGPATLLGLMEDISGEIGARTQLEFQATHDALTGLYNRRAFETALARAAGRAVEGGHELALMYVDLDGFKFVNDSLGHGIGDLLLPAVAERLANCLEESATLSRVGGDEFTIILEDTGSIDKISELASRMLSSLREPFHVVGYELFVGASIGISRLPQDGSAPMTLLQHADAAMYRAKNDGKGRYCYFTPEMAARAQAHLTMEGDLRRAMERGELEVHYQPLICSTAKSLVRFEALCRWRHPSQGYISPDDFIPVAEDTGLIVQIGDWVLEEACRQALRWNALSSTPIQVAVNVSVVQLAEGSFLRRLTGVLRETGLRPDLLELELTESAVMQSDGNAAAMLKELRELGVSIALDDFGTGYSSLSRLRKMPLDTLKIDRSFIHDLASSSASERLVSSLISLAHGIGLKVVSEGVEDLEQAELLKKLGCDMFQGFLFSKALAAEDACHFVEQAATSHWLESFSALASAVNEGKLNGAGPWRSIPVKAPASSEPV